MKKIFIALAVAVALIFTVAPSQARLGGPDLEPGNDVLLPFFIASMSGHGNINTLLVITDFQCGLVAKNSTTGAANNAFHYTVYTRKSATVYDDYLKGTKCDIVSTDALTILSNLSKVDKTKLEYDMDGDGTNDTYVGYIYFENVDKVATTHNTANSVGAQILLVDLAKGMASSANAPVKEYVTTPRCSNFTNGSNLELFSPNALGNALSALATTAGSCTDPTNFGLYPRYYVNSANGSCWFFMWKSYNNGTATSRAPYDGTYHVYWYDNEEHKVSASFDWPYELLIMNVNDYIPASLWASSTYPKEGFVAFELPDLSSKGFYGDEEFLGYTWLKDEGAASESWTVLNPMWRYAW